MIEQELAARLSQNLQRVLDDSVQDMIRRTLEVMMMDPAWIQKIETQVQQHMTSRVMQHLSNIDLGAVVRAQADQSLETVAQRLRDELRSPGIVDTTTQPQLTVMDQAVVVENTMISRDSQVINDMKVGGVLTVQDFIVRGTINTDNRSWDELAERVRRTTVDSINQQWRQELVQQVLDLARTSGIDFREVSVGGERLIQNGILSAQVRESSLERVGDLEKLRVLGPANFCDTMTVKPRRVGINTADPEMALSIWDEEVTIQAGKIARDRAYIGTGRRQNLVLGVDRNPALEIDAAGLVTIKSLRLDRFCISHSNEAPGWSGTRGDLVFNHDPRPDTPFAWVCLGAFRWQPLRSAA